MKSPCKTTSIDLDTLHIIANINPRVEFLNVYCEETFATSQAFESFFLVCKHLLSLKLTIVSTATSGNKTTSTMFKFPYIELLNTLPNLTELDVTNSALSSDAVIEIMNNAHNKVEMLFSTRRQN